MSFAAPSLAATLTFGLDVEFSGADEPLGTAPWISATFDDSFGGNDTVRLTMSASNLVGVEFVGEWLFNFDPLLDLTKLTFAYVDVPFDDIHDGQTGKNTGVNAFTADGDGSFDIQFDFPPPPGNFDGKFTTGETVVYDITYIGGNINVGSFNFLSELGGGNGAFLSAAHVQGIGAGGNGSGWIGFVPEPATGSLLAFGLIGLAARRRR